MFPRLFLLHSNTHSYLTWVTQYVNPIVSRTVSRILKVKSSSSLVDFHLPFQGSPGGTVVKNLPANTGDTRGKGSIPGSGRYTGVRNGNHIPVFLPGNFMDRGAWWATVHRVPKSQTWLNNWTRILPFQPLSSSPNVVLGTWYFFLCMYPALCPFPERSIP